MISIDCSKMTGTILISTSVRNMLKLRLFVRYEHNVASVKVAVPIRKLV